MFGLGRRRSPFLRTPIAEQLEEPRQLSAGVSMLMTAARGLLTEERIDEANATLAQAAIALDDASARLQELIQQEPVPDSRPVSKFLLPAGAAFVAAVFDIGTLALLNSGTPPVDAPAQGRDLPGGLNGGSEIARVNVQQTGTNESERQSLVVPGVPAEDPAQAVSANDASSTTADQVAAPSPTTVSQRTSVPTTPVSLAPAGAQDSVRYRSAGGAAGESRYSGTLSSIMPLQRAWPVESCYRRWRWWRRG